MPAPQTPDEVLARYPGPIELLPERRRWQIILGFNLAFVAAGVLLLLQGQKLGLYMAIAFGLVAIVPAMVALPGAAKLILERDGFTATSLYRGKKVQWLDVSEFQVAEMSRGGQRIVVFDDNSPREGSHLLSGSKFAGRNSALPDSYGLTAESLAAVLNRWRMQALADAPA